MVALIVALCIVRHWEQWNDLNSCDVSGLDRNYGKNFDYIPSSH